MLCAALIAGVAGIQQAPAPLHARHRSCGSTSARRTPAAASSPPSRPPTSICARTATPQAHRRRPPRPLLGHRAVSCASVPCRRERRRTGGGAAPGRASLRNLPRRVSRVRRRRDGARARRSDALRRSRARAARPDRRTEAAGLAAGDSPFPRSRRRASGDRELRRTKRRLRTEERVRTEFHGEHAGGRSPQTRTQVALSAINALAVHLGWASSRRAQDADRRLRGPAARRAEARPESADAGVDRPVGGSVQRLRSTRSIQAAAEPKTTRRRGDALRTLANETDGQAGLHGRRSRAGAAPRRGHSSAYYLITASIAEKARRPFPRGPASC